MNKIMDIVNGIKSIKITVTGGYAIMTIILWFLLASFIGEHVYNLIMSKIF